MKKKKILVLEDEALIAYDIKQILDSEGYETVIDCFNVDIAIAIVNEAQIDLVLIDINLNHKKTGIDFAYYLTKNNTIPFLFITSYSDKNTLDNLLTFPYSAFITKPFKSQDLISLVYLALNKSIHKSKVEESITSSTPFAITQVVNYIHKNLSERLDMDSLAAMTTWEPEYFGKIFKKYLGISPYQYVLKQKVELAKEKLTHSKDPCLEALSFELGFSSYSNFYNAFKKYANLSPQEYRKILG